MPDLEGPRYEVVDLPDGVPHCLGGEAPQPPTTSATTNGSNRSSFSFGASSTAKSKPSAKGFDPGKALKGVGTTKNKPEEAESACRTRGDGLFDGGAAFKREGNRVVMAPNAFSPENAMSTFEELERSGMLGGGRKEQKAPVPKEIPPSVLSAAESTSMSSVDPDMVKGIFDLLNMGDLSMGSATNVPMQQKDDRSGLFDLGDDDPPRKFSPNNIPSNASRTEGPSRGPSSFAFPVSAEEPVYSITRKSSTNKCPYEHLQVDIDLPKLNSSSEADIRVSTREVALSAGPLYRLRAKLPCAVKDMECAAKWSKTKRRLTLTLPVASQDH